MFNARIAQLLQTAKFTRIESNSTCRWHCALKGLANIVPGDHFKRVLKPKLTHNSYRYFFLSMGSLYKAHEMNANTNDLVHPFARNVILYLQNHLKTSDQFDVLCTVHHIAMC